VDPHSHVIPSRLWTNVHRTFFVKRRKNCHSLYCFPILHIFSGSGDIRDQILKWSKIDRNLACFWPQFFFLGGGAPPPECLEWDYKIFPDSDHVAKFQGDRSRELGERLAKQEKEGTSRVNHKPVRNGGSGRPNKLCNCGSSVHCNSRVLLTLN